MNRIDRLFGILTLLQGKKYVPADQIAERFEISVRTVYRDIKALCEQGIPLSFEPNKGYFVIQGYFLPPVSFSSEEANALLLMESLVTGFADRSILTHYSQALNKVKAVLRGPQKERLERLNQNIRFQLPACVQNDYEYLMPIQEAISHKTAVVLEYKNSREEMSLRRIDPLGLVFYAFSWHVIGWCHLRRDYRDFKVSRILAIRPTTEPFACDQHISLSEYMKQLPVAY